MTLKLFVRFVDHGHINQVQIIEANVARALELMGPGSIIVWRPHEEDASKDQCTNEYQLR